MLPFEEHLFSSSTFLPRLAFDVFPVFSLLSGGLIPRAFCSLQILVVSGARLLRAVGPAVFLTGESSAFELPAAEELAGNSDSFLLDSQISVSRSAISFLQTLGRSV